MRVVYLVFFAVFCIFPAAAYIDPGTGSMLFSLLTGLAVTVFFFAKNFIINLKQGFIFKDFLHFLKRSFKVGKNNGTEEAQEEKRDGIALYSEGAQYWNVFKPILEALSERGADAVFYTSDEHDPALSASLPHIQVRCIGRGNAAYRFLNFLEADICLMTTPALDVFQLKRSPGVKTYIHILHAPTDATLYRLFGIDYFDCILLTGDYQKKDIRALEKLRHLPEKELVTVGCTYLDVLSQAALPACDSGAPSRSDPFTILVAPSWGANGILRRYGMKLLAPLAQSSCRVVVRPHPQSLLVEQDTVDGLRKALVPYTNVEWDFSPDNLASLSRADALVSDFSGVMFDYAFLFEGPVVYPSFEFDTRPYDAADLEDEAWTFRAIHELGVRLDDDFFERSGDIESALRRIAADAQSPEKKTTRQRLRDEAWMYRGEAGKRAADYLVLALSRTNAI